MRDKCDKCVKGLKHMQIECDDFMREYAKEFFETRCTKTSPMMLPCVLDDGHEGGHSWRLWGGLTYEC